jgi:transcriptional regulator with XRE-family HTH domain
MNNNIDDVDLNIPIGTVVRAWREARGLTVTQLAEKAGRPVTKGYLSELEHNKTLHPGNVHLTRLARALEIPVRYLINRYSPDEVAEAQQKQRRPVRFGGGYPVADAPEERLSHEYGPKLQELLQEIEEISQRIEGVRRTVEQLLQAGDRRE